MTNPSKPSAEGFRMPAEWAPQSAMWLAWPYNLEETWAGHIDGAEQAFVRMIEEMSPHQIVNLLVPDEKIQARATKKLKASKANFKNLRMHTVVTGDIWIRDYGPIFITKESPHEVAYTKWIYNAYGNKYEELLVGNEVADNIPLEKYRRFDTDIVLEGGSIDVNGSGTLLTTESCLLSPDRNPHMTKKEIEKALSDYLGATNVLWLGEGIEGDDTTGHVDDLTRFVGPSTVVTAVEEDPNDGNYKPLRENADRLKTMKDEKGRPLTVLELPMPRKFMVEDRRMAATYANFLIANNVVLVPVYAQSSDDVALDILGKCFPDRTVIGIDCRELIWGYGSIHCASQQQPL
ncbi:MAG: agmatine deiminase family protein [Candidatus Peribacteraceae bacterium]|nr:agmatine deiminase family protein [Candidatus Peribacteraceae bacterium]